MIHTYTAFCQEADGTGTIWISSVSVDAGNEEEAIQLATVKAVEDCAEDWGGEDSGFNSETVHCLGLIEGNVKVAYWEDLND